MVLLLFSNIIPLKLRFSNHVFKIKKDALKLGESPPCRLQIEKKIVSGSLK